MNTLRNLKIFEWISVEIVDPIIKNSAREIFHAGDTIILEGTPSNGKWYIIEEGNVAIKIHGAIVWTLTEGSMFGEIALLNEDKRSATVEAMSDTRVIVITQESLIGMINNGDNSINKYIIQRIEENMQCK